MYFVDGKGNRVYTLKKQKPDGKPTLSAHPGTQLMCRHRFTPFRQRDSHRTTNFRLNALRARSDLIFCSRSCLKIKCDPGHFPSAGQSLARCCRHLGERERVMEVPCVKDVEENSAA